MNNDIIRLIPSKAMRKHLTKNPLDLSILQEATIIFHYAPEKDKPQMFQRLIDRSNSEDERLLLSAEISDGYDASCKIYSERFPHEGFPLFPFLEVCHLPVLFKPGDVIRWKNELFYVGGIPYLREGYCDFSDESYLCYPLSLSYKYYDDLCYGHEHIHVCEVERVSFTRLNSAVKHIAYTIRKILARKKHSLPHENYYHRAGRTQSR